VRFSAKPLNGELSQWIWNDGHAGIFSNSMDVAKIMQLYLLKKEIMEIDNTSEKHSVTLILVIFCVLKVIEGSRF
jgi:hypothetical protein